MNVSEDPENPYNQAALVHEKITLCWIVAHCFTHLFPLYLYSVIHPLSFSQSLEIDYSILFSERIPVEEYPSLSSPFTHAFLLLYLTCKEHLFVTFYVCFVHFLIFFFHLFVLCPFLNISSYCLIMVCLLMPHFSLSFL